MILLFSEHWKENLLHPFIATINKKNNISWSTAGFILTFVCFTQFAEGEARNGEKYFYHVCLQTLWPWISQKTITPAGQRLVRGSLNQTQHAWKLLLLMDKICWTLSHLSYKMQFTCVMKWPKLSLWWGKRHDGIHRVRGTEHTDTGSEVEALPAPRVVTDPQQHVFPLMVQQNVLPPSSFFFLKAFFFSLFVFPLLLSFNVIPLNPTWWLFHWLHIWLQRGAPSLRRSNFQPPFSTTS